jgi:ribose-phosphate pyrophosphokinase
MPVREEKRNLNSIPVGTLGIIPLQSCAGLGDMVDRYLVKWRAERESEHKDSLAFAGYQRDGGHAAGEAIRMRCVKRQN